MSLALFLLLCGLALLSLFLLQRSSDDIPGAGRGRENISTFWIVSGFFGRPRCLVGESGVCEASSA
jgi:hypothetical protein